MVSRGVKRASKFYHSFMNSAEATPGTSSEQCCWGRSEGLGGRKRPEQPGGDATAPGKNGTSARQLQHLRNFCHCEHSMRMHKQELMALGTKAPSNYTNNTYFWV